MEISPAIPVLRIFDEAKAREFYGDFLGFTFDWEHRFGPDAPLYGQIHRGDLVLHLSEHFGDSTPGATVFIRLTEIAALHAELNAKHYRHARPGMQDNPWGVTMEVADPFGKRLRFCEAKD